VREYWHRFERELTKGLHTLLPPAQGFQHLCGVAREAVDDDRVFVLEKAADGREEFPFGRIQLCDLQRE
jgi:hypothetical protein